MDGKVSSQIKGGEMKTILVTGGAGFIGFHLCERLLREGYRVICFDNFDPFYDPNLKIRNVEELTIRFPETFSLVTGDIRNRDHLKETFQKEKIDLVFHLAAKAGVRPSLLEPQLYEEVNIRGTIFLLETCKGFGVKKFVFASSSSVYGESNRVPFSEEDFDLRPISPYGVTKRAGELICYCYHHLYRMEVACLRIFTAYGPRQRPEMAIHKFTALVDQDKEIPVYGDGSSRRDYTYIDDLVDGMMAVLDRHQGFEIYNLGESRTTSLNELIHLIEEALGKRAKIQRLDPQKGDVSITYADIRKAKQRLGYQPKINIEEGIKRFIRWYKETKRI